MKYLWYKTMRQYVKFGVRLFFKEIRVEGLQNIPKDKALLFVSGHRNGMIDPIIISTSNNLIHYYLTRASSFKNPMADKLLRSLNLIPIYRIRDGVDSIKKNAAIFDACASVFKKKESVIIFPEGEDGLVRHIRTLKKGFARIIYHYLDKNPDAEVMIVPVGLNYNNVFVPGGTVTVIYGNAFSSKEFHNPEAPNEAFETLKLRVKDELVKLTTHIEDLENHDKIVGVLKSKGIDFLDPKKANKVLATTTDWDIKTTSNKQQQSFFSKVLHLLFSVNTFFPLLIWRKLKHTINSIKLVPTFKFGLSLALIPFFYLVQSVILGFFTNYKWALTYLVFSIVLLVLYKNNRTVSTQ